jgi:ketosteroid isomerase-like protein
MIEIRDSRIDLFARLERAGDQNNFWSHVADDVEWTVRGTHPLAGRFHGKQALLDSAFGRLMTGASARVQRLFVDGDTTIVELSPTADPANPYCLVCRFDGDMIVEVRAYLDSMMVAHTMLRSELATPIGQKARPLANPRRVSVMRKAG